MLSVMNASSQVITKKIYVNDHYTKCNSQTKCLQIKDSLASNWKSFSGNIENFHFEEGNFYQLLVEVHSSKKTPSDSETYHLVLNKILQQNKNDVADIFELDDIPWFLTKISANKKTASIKSLDAFIIFHPDENKIRGHSGCNSFSTELMLTDSSINIQKISATKMKCIESITGIEKEFFSQLEKVNRYKVKSKELFLYNHKTLLLTFKLK
jgi:heat shock protein HslJ